MKYLLINFLLPVVLFPAFEVSGQASRGQMIDEIVVKVDDYIVLKSDLDKAYMEYISSGQDGGDEVRCGILENLVINKLLVAKAEIDSVVVPDAEVQMNLEQRMQIIISQIGSEQQLEEYYGKSVEQFKEELIDDIKEQMVADKMQRVITEDVKITPTEVKNFFNRIPQDSLPFLSAEVSVGQIVKIPEAGKNQKEKVRQQALNIRDQILYGKDISDVYGEWKIAINDNNQLIITDKEGNNFTGTWQFNADDRLFTIELNEISFTANEFQSVWKVKKFGNDSIRFKNNALNNTSEFYIVNRNTGSGRTPPVVTNEFLKDEWEVVKFTGNGERFDAMAKEYSDDPGSAKNGGELGWATRGTMVPEFEAAVFRMKPGEISMPIESDFGFHIIQLIDRRGNEFNARHILLRPDYSEVDFEDAENFLDSLRTLILEDTLIFERTAKEHSDDNQTAGNGGFLIDETGSSSVSVDDLDPGIFFTIDTMQVGNISKPVRYRMEDGKEAVRILYYKNRIRPHQASLKEDYQKIQQAALNEKKQKALTEWFESAKNEVFVKIDDEYKYCRILEH